MSMMNNSPRSWRPEDAADLKTPVIRPLSIDDVAPAMQMVGRVFDECIAPDYAEEGIAEFYRFIDPAAITAKIESGGFHFWGAFIDDEPVGIVGLRPPMNIALFSVDKRYRRRGIGRKLFETALRDNMVTESSHRSIAVNASPYAVDIYRRLGFVPTDAEQTKDGMRFTPMECKL